MLSLHRLRPVRTLFRANTTLQSVATPLDPPPHLPPSNVQPTSPGTSSVATSPALISKTKGRNRNRILHRPKISRALPRDWNRPLGVGVLPAYDEALKLIRKDSKALKGAMGKLRIAIGEAEKAALRDEAAIVAMKEKLQIVEVQSEINLPDVRWKFANGMADMSKAVYRHMAEQRWRNEGGLDLLMERIYQMNVVPDLLPALHPSLDLRIAFPTPLPRSLDLGKHTRRIYHDVEPGIYLSPEQTRNPPKVFANVFHTNTRLYTLLMVDPDVPDETNHSYQTYLHWLQPNIPLSARRPSRVLANSHTAYIPPHPQRGTPYHRYVLLLLPQPSPTKQLSIPIPSDEARLGFNVREFMDEYRLDAGAGGGAHMWRETWTADVSAVYRDVLTRGEEPRYGRRPKADPYAEVKNMKRYV